jgi:hypothetical protein
MLQQHPGFWAQISVMHDAAAAPTFCGEQSLTLKAAPMVHKSCEQPESQHVPLSHVPEQHSPLPLQATPPGWQSTHKPFSQTPEQHL